jgi:adenylate cyclase
MSFWKELSRRNVVKVGIAYAVAAWLIIHPVDIIFPILHLPEWSITLIAAFLIVCFPFVLLFSWVYEITPKGLKKTKEVPVSKSITQITGKRLNYIIVGLLVVALGYFAVDKYFISHGAVETKQVPAVSEAVKTKKTIAILPFTDLSPEKDQEYFVDGLSEEILNSLCQIADLGVAGRTSSFSFKGSTKTIQEIANALGVENVLEGSVRKAGNELRITAQLVRASDDLHLWSKIYDRELKDIFSVQEDIATAVANELKARLGIGKSFKQLGGTENTDAYAFYLIARGQTLDTLASVNRAMESIDKAIKIDPQFALAWACKSFYHHRLAIVGPANQNEAEKDAGLHAAQKAIEIEPNLAIGYSYLSNIKLAKGEFIEAQKDYLKALELVTEPSLRYEVEAPLYDLALGYLVKAKEHLEEFLQKDPFQQVMRAFYFLNFHILGDTQRAEEEYKRGLEMFEGQWIMGNENITLVRLGSGSVLSRDQIMTSDPIFDATKKNLTSPKEALAELRQYYNDEGNRSTFDFMEISLLAAYFGDLEFAMDALEKEIRLNPVDMMFVWLPVMKEVRQTPRFKAFVKKIGLVDYWNKFGWPDMCHKLDNGDFECD